ncbi:zinc finger, c2h2-type/integrase, DNA-binding protein [Fusarium flagelliforme]|uniref:Zinc finger, c2h2-type/integrase, DNA-binding protein n=1 Tax=Fusarium flagelliforme TaxID=2675880 RepID=A0A395N1C3_9HYPO|nr:zinc finger, c2h2-type/integrase, DNA-binding protein [Fusarium flagelliforme]
MPCIQPLLAPDELRGVPAYGDNVRPPVSDTTSFSSTGSPLEAFGDVPSRQTQTQTPCRLEALSACIDNPARARIIAVMALDIFAHGAPLNAHFDRWICPFSNCKTSFSDPKDMVLHAAQCAHVSPDGAYCNCCCEYYNFPGNSPAYRLSAGESLSPAVKTSAMAKGKKKIAGLISRCSGSASSSRSQLSAVGQRSSGFTSSGSDSMSESPSASRKGSIVSSLGDAELPTSVRPGEALAELGTDYHFVELDSSHVLPARSPHRSDANARTQQRSTQSSISTLTTMSTACYMDSMSTDYGEFSISPTDYSAPDLQQHGGTQTHGVGVPDAASEVAQHEMQMSLAPPQSPFWHLGHRQASATWNLDGSGQSSQTAQGLEVVVPNFSHRLQSSPAGNGGDGHFRSHESSRQTDVIASIEAQPQFGSGDSFDFSHHQSSFGHAPFDVGMAIDSMEAVGIAETSVEIIPPPLRRSTGSSGSYDRIRISDEMRYI